MAFSTSSTLSWGRLPILALLLLHYALRGSGQEISVIVMTVTVLDEGKNEPVSGAIITPPQFGWVEQTNAWEFITDAKGVATVKHPSFQPGGQSFGFVVQHPEYASREVMFVGNVTLARDVLISSALGDGGKGLPPAYTVRLQRGITVGGSVRNEQGEPVVGAALYPSVSANRNFWSEQSVQSWESPSLLRKTNPRIVTDRQGRWTIDRFPADAENVRIEIERAGGGRVTFATASAMQHTVESYGELSLDALRTTNAVLTLRDGVTVRGMVVDESGRPVGGVQIKTRAPRLFHVLPFVFTNNPDGRFELPHRDDPFVLTAASEGYSITSTNISPAANLPDVRVVMRPALPLRVRVLGENDEPISGARFRAIDYRTPGHVLTWSDTTGADGRLTWQQAPRIPVAYAITPTNYPYRAVTLEPDGNERVLKLKKDTSQFRFTVKALDETSGKAITNFEVRRQLASYEGYQELGKAASNGVFSFTVRTNELRQGFGSYRISVHSEGYAAWTSQENYADEGDREFVVKLTAARPPGGIVLQPDGKPARDARVFLNASESSLFSGRPGDFDSGGRSAETQRTGEDGSFRFSSAQPENRLLISHPTGFNFLTVEDLQRSNRIPLQAWASVEGVLKVGGKPRANERISVRAPVNWNNVVNYHLIYSVNTDANGRFTFTNLPPGDFMLYRTPHLIMYTTTTESHRHAFDLGPGETKKLEYGFNGRSVIGHVEADGEVDWKNDPHVLEVKLPPPPRGPNYYSYLDPKEFQKARQRHARSAEVIEYERKRQQFQVVFDKNGDFHVDDVPPGTYQMRLRVTKPPANRNAPRYGREQEIGTLTREIIVPPGTEDLDLGSFYLPLKITEVVSGPSLDFKGVTFDGRPFDSVSLRGKTTAVLFWARWAPQSAAQLADLRKLSTEMSTNGSIAFVSVNFDERTDLARELMADMPRGWTHVRAEGPAGYSVTEQLKIDTLPTLLIIDSNGRVAARDVAGKRIKPVLERVLRKNVKG